MGRLIKSELYRMKKSKKYKIALIISIVLTLICCKFVEMFGVGFYNPLETASLNSLNFSTFLLREMGMLMLFVFVPLICIESFSSERTNGTLRMIATRPYSRSKIIISKLISTAIVIAIYLGITFLVIYLYGMIFLPSASGTEFYKLEGEFTAIGSVLYCLRFYFYEYFILLGFMGICALVSVITPNSVVAYIGSIAVTVGLGFVTDKFTYLLSSAEYIFKILARTDFSILVYGSILFIISIIGSIFIFQKRDYRY